VRRSLGIDEPCTPSKELYLHTEKSLSFSKSAISILKISHHFQKSPVFILKRSNHFLKKANHFPVKSLSFERRTFSTESLSFLRLSLFDRLDSEKSLSFFWYKRVSHISKRADHFVKKSLSFLSLPFSTETLLFLRPSCFDGLASEKLGYQCLIGSLKRVYHFLKPCLHNQESALYSFLIIPHTFSKEPYIRSQKNPISSSKEPYVHNETSLLSRAVLWVDMFLKRAMYTYPEEPYIPSKELYIHTENSLIIFW